MKSITISLISLFTFSQSFSQEFIGSKIDLEQIKQNTINFSQYVMDSNYEMIGASYTLDAKIFPNNTLIIEGTKAIVNYWKIPDDVQITHHKISQKEIKIIGDEAYDYGYYEGQTKKPNGELVDWKGKYVIVWRKVNNTWKMYLDIWNGVK
ncbi:DUF4440 domain-containing protein [uncultured Croceitalea sp.]|uniref:YybH family protein n=1 Tax=uncultured Croceitalea sp. TaxID=1798908 RepID=UPI0033065B2D